ncbi:hypothetical protein Tco_0180462 [Tanacetum coccineum]
MVSTITIHNSTSSSSVSGVQYTRTSEERPATPEPAWTIPSSHKSDVENNWASALATTYEPPGENSLLAKIGDMTTFMNSYCQRMNKTVRTQADFEGHAYEVIKPFYPDVIHIQFQMEECHKMLVDQVDWANPEGDQVRINVNRPLPLGGPPAYSRYGYDYLSEIVLRRADHQEHKIAEKDFKNLYPSDFEDLNLLLLQGHLDHLSGSDKRMLSTAVKLWTRNLVIRQGYEFKHDYTIIESPRAVIFPVNNNERKIMRFNEIYKFSDGTLTQKDVTRSKEFITAIERRLKTRRIYQNLECFVGRRVRDIDYRLLQRTE